VWLGKHVQLLHKTIHLESTTPPCDAAAVNNTPGDVKVAHYNMA
jgi:hypothetical protein